jgi:hypothetical protein
MYYIKKKKPRSMTATRLSKFSESEKILTLRVLITAASTSQAVFLTLNFTRVARQESSFLESAAVSRIHIQESPGDAVLHSASLTREAATLDVNQDIETTNSTGQFQRLHNQHTSGGTREVFLESATIDSNDTFVASAGTEINASDRIFPLSDFV